jgi:DNA (cytosine-5)-methyltransferase 1
MIRVGTDCSGIEAPIQALKQLKIPFKHVFSSDIDKYCIQSIKANYKQEILFGDPDGSYPNGDITKRNINDVPDIDLYVCGFPCQPFSLAGSRKGLKDKRGNVFFSCIKVIKEKTPSVFILENVKGLINHNKGKTIKVIERELEKLKEYDIYGKVLNTKDYGIPQNRERLYIVGIKKNLKINFKWPKPIRMKNLFNFIDYTDTKKNIVMPSRKKLLKIIPKNALFIDMGFTKYAHNNSYLYSPCIVAQTLLWCVPLHRYANFKELLKLQGFLKFKQVVSNKQFTKQIGNSMSVNVLKKILNNIY